MRSHTKEEREIIKNKIASWEINGKLYIWKKISDNVNKKKEKKLLLLKPWYMKLLFW